MYYYTDLDGNAGPTYCTFVTKEQTGQRPVVNYSKACIIKRRYDNMFHNGKHI